MGTKTYTASEPVYISSEGRMVYAGQKFTVPEAAKVGETWLDEDGNPIEKDPLDHDGDGRKGGSRPRKAATEASATEA